MTNLAIQADRAEQAKAQQERSRKRQAEAVQQAATNGLNRLHNRLLDALILKQKQWALRIQWFGDDEAMTYAAFGIHKKLVEDEGFDPRPMSTILNLDSRMEDRVSRIRAQKPLANDPLRRLLGANKQHLWAQWEKG